MKTFVHITAELLPAKRAVLAAIYPEAQRHGYGFDLLLPQADLRVPRVLEALASVGYRKWEKGERNQACEYTYGLRRDYEPSDYAQAEYLELRTVPADSVSHGGRDEQGRLRLQRPTLKDARRTGLDFLGTIHHILVLQGVRDVLMQGGFRHASFRPTVLVTGRGPYPGRNTPIPWDHFRVTTPWWELTSDLVLPPLSPSMDLRDDAGNPVRPGDCSKGCCPREGDYAYPELHYRRSDLSKIDPFDVALTFENFGVRGHTEARATIVSKRFFDYCQQEGIKGRWAPVRIDEE